MNILTPQEHGTFTTAMLTSMNQEETVEAIFKKGDTLFDDPSHQANRNSGRRWSVPDLTRVRLIIEPLLTRA